MGMIYKRGNIFWVKYYRGGRPLRESSGSTKEVEAKRLLRLREGDIERGLPVTPRVNRCRFDELAADVVADYRVNGKRSLSDTKRRINKHLTPFFGGRRMAAITTADIRRYVEQRQDSSAANAQINRELSALKRCFSLGIQSGKLLVKPYVPMLQEDNVRTGFFERAQFEAVRDRLPAPLRPVVTFPTSLAGARRAKFYRCNGGRWTSRGGTVRLDPGTTKNREGRVFPFTVELRALLEAQLENTRQLEREQGVICPSVFHRNGTPIRYFRRTWLTACRAAGCPGLIPHDFRRTAVRNLVRAGIPERVAMTMTGHKTRSVFERYNIVSEGDLMDAARRLDAAGDLSPKPGMQGR